MKKKLVLAIGGVAAVSVLVFGIYYSNASQVATTMTAEEISKKVTSQYPGEITEIEKETEFNRAVYEVELTSEKAEYDLKLDGSTGEVLEIEEKPVKKSPEVAEKEKEDVKPKPKEDESSTDSDDLVIKEKEGKEDTQDKSSESHKKDKDNKKQKSQSEKKDQSSKRAVISVDEAINIALKEFPGEVDDVDLEREDGRLIYEIEIERGDKEAEFEIDAYTGEIIVIEIDED